MTTYEAHNGSHPTLRGRPGETRRIAMSELMVERAFADIEDARVYGQAMDAAKFLVTILYDVSDVWTPFRVRCQANHAMMHDEDAVRRMAWARLGRES